MSPTGYGESEMATVNWTEANYGFDFNHIIQRDLGTFGTFSGTATSVTVLGTMDGVLPSWPEFSFVMSDIYYGSFQYGPLTEPTSGTINTIERQSSRVTVGQVTGLNITLAEAKAVASTASREDNMALFAREFAGNDALTGGASNDRFEGFAGDDIVLGFTGNDTLDGGEGADVLNGGLGSDFIYGGNGTDTLVGELGDDWLDGGGSQDALNGGDGSDSLYGNSAQDTVTGGRGADKLYGGSEADYFVFVSTKDSTVAKSGRDTIFDFSSRQKDKIDLLAIDANTKKSGNQAFKFIGSQDFQKKAGELQWDKVKGGVYVYGDTNGDGKADFAIFLKGLSKISKGDFFL